jgi:hypothetical protein
MGPIDAPKAAASGHGDIFRIPSVTKSQREHPAEKPIGLLKELLRVCGDVNRRSIHGIGQHWRTSTADGKAIHRHRYRRTVLRNRSEAISTILTRVQVCNAKYGRAIIMVLGNAPMKPPRG